MEPLTKVCIRLALDYFQARAALIRGDVRGELRGRRLFIDADDAERWKGQRAAETATLGGGSAA